MRILLTNDDGIDAVGINVLAEEFRRDNDIFMVAPDSERSAFSHSLTISRGLKVGSVDKGKGITAYAINGTPADCVKIALLELIKDGAPDLIISGINNGPNLGSDIMYSGTVAAASEGAYMGVPSVAVSLDFWNADKKHYTSAAKFLHEKIGEICKLFSFGAQIINVNYPTTVPFKGVKLAKMGVVEYSDAFHLGENNLYTLKGMPLSHGKNDGDCDVELTKKGYCTLTPLSIDRTDYRTLERLKNVGEIKL